MLANCKLAGLKEPDFKVYDGFKITIYRTGQATPQATPQVSGEVTEEVRRVGLVLNGEMKRTDIQKILQLKHDDFFRVNYIIPSLSSGYVEMKYPDNPNHPNQRYRLTTKGKRLKTKLKKEIDKK